MGMSWHTAPDSLSTLRGSPLSTDHTAVVEELLAKLQANQSAGLAMALRRWMRSKAQTDVADQFIELRIALESLFLKDSSGESRFRVASHAAWYLGQSLEERTAHQKTVSVAYEVASRAVHTGAVKNAEHGRELLVAAQGLVRRAILKRLDEPNEPDWGKLVLGRDPRAASVPESPSEPDTRSAVSLAHVDFSGGLIEALQSDKLVVLAGAGVSMLGLWSNLRRVSSLRDEEARA